MKRIARHYIVKALFLLTVGVIAVGAVACGNSSGDQELVGWWTQPRDSVGDFGGISSMGFLADGTVIFYPGNDAAQYSIKEGNRLSIETPLVQKVWTFSISRSESEQTIRTCEPRTEETPASVVVLSIEGALFCRANGPPQIERAIEG